MKIRMTLFTLFVLVFSLVPAIMVVAEEQLPAMQKIADLKEIAREWNGELKVGNRDAVSYNLVIKENGTWNAQSPNARTNGIVEVQRDGKAYWRSNTTGRTGTYTLHQDGDVRILIIEGQGGVTGKVRATN